MERGFPYSNVFQEVIDHIAQYTHQWWLRAPRSPFRGNVYLSAFINRDYNVRDEFYYKGAGEVESTWLGATESQELLGFEKLLTKETWHSCAMALERSIPAETGILAFSDAVAQYMADNDLRCLLNLTDSFEILANKKQMLDGHRPESRKDKLLEKTPLASSPSKAVITKLFADRDNVAHGRQPYALNRDGTTTIESYLGAVGEVVETYLKTLKLGEWEKASRMEISRKKKKSKKPRKQ
jgi:hypothetical protein